MTDTANDVEIAEVALNELSNRARPLADQRSQLSAERDRLHHHLNIDRPLLHSLSGNEQQLTTAKNRLAALDTWADWANGNTPRPADLLNAAQHLHRAGDPLALLAAPLTSWIQQHNLAPQRPARTVQPQHEARPQSPGLDIGL